MTEAILLIQFEIFLECLIVASFTSPFARYAILTMFKANKIVENN